MLSSKNLIVKPFPVWEAIAQRREALGYATALDFARRNGLEQRTWYRIESGDRRNFEYFEIPELAQLLKWTPNDLYGLTSPLFENRGF